MKRLLGWKKLAFHVWDNHLYLNVVKTCEEFIKLSRRVQINLANEFEMSITKQLNWLVV